MLPADSNIPPVLVIAGTQANIEDLLADSDPRGIGYRQFERNVDSVTNWLRSVTNQTGVNPNIIGKSLGGALAQSFAARYTNQGGSLNQVVTFNSPGINDSLANEFAAENVAKVTHLIAYGDIVSLVGDEFISGEAHLYYWDSDMNSLGDILPYVREKHRNSGAPQGRQFIDNFSSAYLSSSSFSYANISGVSSAARNDWSSFNSRIDSIPVLGDQLTDALENRGRAESARRNIGRLLGRIDSSVDILTGLVQNPISVIDDFVDNSIDTIGGFVSRWNPFG